MMGASTDLFEQVWKKHIILTTKIIKAQMPPAMGTIIVQKRTTERTLINIPVIESFSACLMWNERYGELSEAFARSATTTPTTPIM